MTKEQRDIYEAMLKDNNVQVGFQRITARVFFEAGINAAQNKESVTP